MGVKLVEGAQLLGREPLILRPEALSAAFSRSVRPVAR
jgi:hypothetical protein